MGLPPAPASYDIVIILLAVAFAVGFPRMRTEVKCSGLGRFAIAAVVWLLCARLPGYGVALALLVVLSTVPCLQPAIAVRSDVETFASPAEAMAAFANPNPEAHRIAEKMAIFTELNRKRDKFHTQLAGIQKDLVGVKEFYVNASKSQASKSKQQRKQKQKLKQTQPHAATAKS